MRSSFLLQVTVLTGPPFETQDTVFEKVSNVSSLLFKKPNCMSRDHM